jgi:hypothetical protein
LDNLRDDEREKLWSPARNVYEVIKNEKELEVGDLDLEYWEGKFGPGAISELETLMKRKLRNSQ